MLHGMGSLFFLGGDYASILPPDPRQGGLDFLLEAGDQFLVGSDKHLLGFDLGTYFAQAVI